jgi:2-polyprenyl-6-methoxyphenol hydroxylase-like FAD-dependent oxidoreductase
MAAVQKVLIVGGGIAGLSAAIALGRRGIATRVIDLHGQADGAAIAITNRAMFALRELGVLEDSMVCGLVMRGGFVRTYGWPSTSTTVRRGPPVRGDTRPPHGVTIFRPELARILREEAEQRGSKVDVGVTFHRLEQHSDRVDVAFDDGTQDAYDLVIGADGTHSSVRASIHPNIEPVYTGHMSFRWLAKNCPQPQLGYHARGDGSVVVIGRLPERIVYVAVGIDTENRRIEQAEARAIVAGVLERYDVPLFAELRAALDEDQQIIVRPFESLFVPAPWHRGRIALIGDAAHTSTPHLSAGGGMAFEDACVLAHELERAVDVSAALDAFMARRGARTQLVVETGLKLLELRRQNAAADVAVEVRRRAAEMLDAPY